MIRLRSLARDLALPTLSGVLYFLSWIGFGIWPLTFLCLVPLIASLRGTTARQAAGRGAWMGFVTQLGGFSWLIHMLRVFAAFPLPLAVLGYFVVCAVQGLLFAAFALVLRWAWHRTSGARYVVLVPLSLVAVEFAIPLLFQSYTGIALMPIPPLIQIAELGGVLLLTAVVGVVNGALADALLRYRPPGVHFAVDASLLTSLLTLLLVAGYGTLRIQQVEDRQASAPHRRVGLTQPNVGEVERLRSPSLGVRTLWTQTLELHGRGAETVIWPEGAYNLRAIREGDDARDLLAGIPVSLIAGATRVHGREIYNSAIAVDETGRIGDHFDKIELLAFGEFIPFGDWFPRVYDWIPLASHLTRGTTTAPLRDGPWRFATFICYEDILPGLVRKTMADHGEGRAHALVNLTNDSWYGDGHEQEEHLQLAAIRTVEHRRWLLRSTSTGISAVVDAAGRVVQRIPRDRAGVLVADVPMLQGTTPYEVLGDWPGWLALAALVGLALPRPFGLARSAPVP